MASVNKVILIGNLGKDPEIRTTPQGTTLARFSLATTTAWKDASGAKASPIDSKSLRGDMVNEIKGVLTEDQRKKLELVARTAKEVWG